MKSLILIIILINIINKLNCLIVNNDDNFDLLILHTNDMHSKFEEITKSGNTCPDIEKNKSCVGGFARLKEEINKYKKWGKDNQKNVIFLNAGDIFVGSDWYSVYKWKICAEFLNILEPDVVTLGNHEFDEGLSSLQQFIDTIKCPIVSSNIDTSKIRGVNKSTILNINDIKIGIIGYLTQETSYLKGVDMLNITDEIEAVKLESERLNDMGVKIIIGLGHSGFKIDKKIAEEVPLIDLVIGGHSNTFLWNGMQPNKEEIQGPYPTVVIQKNGKKVPVVQAYAYTLYLGRLNVTFNSDGDLINYGGQPEFLTSDIKQDQEVLKLLDKYRPGVIEVNKETVGRSSVYLDGMCRTKECNFGNLITDAMVYYVANENLSNEKIWTNAAIALYNAGNLRNSINVTYTKGNITKGELLAALPFENELVSIVLKGKDLLDSLEYCVAHYENNFVNGQFLQVSGLKVVYDLNREPGNRVVSVKVRCSNCSIPKYEALVESKDYNIITTDFILNGGDGFSIIKENSKNIKEYQMKLFDLLLWYLKKQSPVYPELSGRITFLNDTSSTGNLIKNLWISLIIPLVVLIFNNH